MTVKKIGYIAILLLMSTVGGDLWAAGASQFTLEDAQKVAEAYIDLLKSGDYATANDSLTQLNQSPKTKRLNLLSTELFYEEFGKIVSYRYKNFSETGSASAVLGYEITYETLVMDKEIIVSQNGGSLQVIRAADDLASSPEALEKMIQLMKRISEASKKELSE